MNLRQIMTLGLAMGFVCVSGLKNCNAQVGEFEMINMDSVSPIIIMKSVFSQGDGSFRMTNGGNSFFLTTPLGQRTVEIMEEAPNRSFVIDELGVGIGTGPVIPAEALHIYADHKTSTSGQGFDQARILVENAHPDTQLRTMFELVNNGPARLVLDNVSSGEAWAIQTGSQDQLIFSRSGTGGGEMVIKKDGAILMGPGNQSNFILARNGNLTIKGTLNQQSDVTSKTAFDEVDSLDILNKVVSLPITSWQYKDDDKSTRHIGPTAQDFRKAFGLGHDEKSIAAVDADGIALVAIQELGKQVAERDAKIAELEDRLNAIEAQLLSLQ